MYFVLVITIASSLMLINLLFTEYLSTKLHMYSTEDISKEDKERSRLKLILIIIIALFSSALLIYG